jgi:lipid-binding SYLF domain-containing protein
MRAIVRSGRRAVRGSTRGARGAIGALVSGIAIAVLIAMAPLSAAAQDYGLEGEARWALNRLTATQPLASILNQRAYATLVFPDITKAGFLVGGE